MNFKLSTKYLLVFVVLAVNVTIFSSCSSPPEAKSTSPPPPSNLEREGNLIVIPDSSPLRQRLTFDTVRLENITLQLTAPAAVEANPDRYARVCPPMAGRIVQLTVRLGDAVHKGQLLATLNSPDYLAAQSDFTKAKSAFHLAKRNFDRQKDLLEHKIAAQREVEQAQKDLEAAHCDLETITDRLRILGLNPETDKLGQSLEIHSPISGQVVEISATAGEFRNDNNAPIMSIADLSTVWLTANVQEKDIRHLAKGQQVNAVFAAYPGEVLGGKVLFIGDLLDPDTRSTKVRVAVANPMGRFKPGMFAKVTFSCQAHKAAVIPATALIQRGFNTCVFVEKSPWQFEPRVCKTGAQMGDKVEVVSGLKAGERIVVKEGVLLND